MKDSYEARRSRFEHEMTLAGWHPVQDIFENIYAWTHVQRPGEQINDRTAFEKWELDRLLPRRAI